MANNELVILSACESGAGLKAGGEGLLSLSRAFIYAGSDGIVSTLYKTDDRVTAFLMKRLHHYRQQGYHPAEALRKGKLDLLESKEINSRLKTPNYWANFIYNGKIPQPESRRIWLLAVIPLLGMVILLIEKFRLKKSTR